MRPKPPCALELAVVLSLGVGCARSEDRTSSSDEGISSDVLQILAEHRDPGVEPEGTWICIAEEDAFLLSIHQQENSGRWNLRRRLLSSKRASARTTPAPAELITTTGDWVSGVLTLEPALGGSTRLHFCRFDGDEFLLPEDAVRFEDPSAPRPKGMVYARQLAGFFRPPDPPVMESLPAGTWEAVEGPGWAWLEIRPTGVSGSLRVRCSQRRGDDPMPVTSFVRATFGAGVLALDSPLFGNSTWYLRRLAEEDWLVQEVKEGHDSEQERMRFRLAGRVTRQEGRSWNGSWDGAEPLEEY